MADRSSIGRSTRRSRGQAGSRNSSARTSAVYNEDYYQPHTLRGQGSRFSLNEQFATTRRDIEFGFDDTSSLFAPSMLSAEVPTGLETEDTVVLGPVIAEQGPPAVYQRRTIYDLLCLPPNPTEAEIRQAYFRLFTLLFPEYHPPLARQAAEAFFAEVQVAFETLMDPRRRLEYNLKAGQFHLQPGVSPCGHSGDYEPWHKQTSLRPNEDGPYVEQDWGIKLDGSASLANQARRARKHTPAPIEPIDFWMGHSVSQSWPWLGKVLDRFAAKMAKRPISSPATSVAVSPIISLRAAAYGTIQGRGLVPPALLVDEYQPKYPGFPSGTSRIGVIHLSSRHKICPSVSVNLQYQLPGFGPESADPAATENPERRENAIIEVETDIFPVAATGVRVSKSILIPNDKVPSQVSLVAKTALWSRQRPRVGASLVRPVGAGLLLCSVDTGDWVLTDTTCASFSSFTKRTLKYMHLGVPFGTPPKVELAYKLGSTFRHHETCTMDRSAARGGLTDLDWRMDHDSAGSWTASAAQDSYCARSSLLYTLDTSSDAPAIKALASTLKFPPWLHRAFQKIWHASRLEAELSASTWGTGLFALRYLRRVGRFSRVGFEIGLSTYSLHLSLYWSRLGQRLSLPIFLGPPASQSSQLLFWIAVLPFSGFAAAKLATHLCRSRLQAQRKAEQQLEIQHKRTEADELTALLSATVGRRQNTERTNGGLVVLSAKFGVKSPDPTHAWGGEEVADVTVAVAALVDDGRLVIPQGVEKANIPGFWDPEPSETKVLYVRYLYKGREYEAEAMGSERLCLPKGL